jgi:lysine-N-methylase
VLNKVDGQMERSLYVSCPEAARLVLLDPYLIKPEESDSYSASREDQFSDFDTDQELAGRKPYQFFWEIRQFILSLIANRTYPLWQRLFFLGMFCERLEECCKQEPSEQVPVLLAEYTEMIQRGQLREQLNSINKHITTQLDFVMRSADQRMRIGADSRRYMECVQEFLQGIQYNPNSTAEEDARHYTAAYSNYYLPFQQKHEYILENFLTNYVFKNLFPFGRPAGLHHEQRTISEEYFLLLAQFALIKGLLIGLAGQQRHRFAPEHVVKVIQSISKISEHSPAYLQSVLQLLDERNLKSAYGMSVLLRN